jgi:molybdenum cofactor guanylyltransferase
MGRPKAWLPFAGEIMLPRVVRLLSAVVAPVVVVAAPNQDVPPLPPEIVVVRDDVDGRGPLQGLAAGLRALTGRAEAAYLSSCDVPFLVPAFVRRLIDLLGNHDICVPDAGGYRQPLAALYRLTVAPMVERLLIDGQLRLAFLLDVGATRFVAAEELLAVDPDLRTLRNLNSPEEYAAAQEEAEDEGRARLR